MEKETVMQRSGVERVKRSSGVICPCPDYYRVGSQPGVSNMVNISYASFHSFLPTFDAGIILNVLFSVLYLTRMAQLKSPDS